MCDYSYMNWRIDENYDPSVCDLSCVHVRVGVISYRTRVVNVANVLCIGAHVKPVYTSIHKNNIVSLTAKCLRSECTCVRFRF